MAELDPQHLESDATSSAPSRKKVLLLVHRVPYPPNKGDKIRSFNLLRWLAERYEVSLGTFLDPDEDLRSVDALRPLCSNTCFAQSPSTIGRAKRGLCGLLRRLPLSVALYRDRRMRSWTTATLRADSDLVVIVFSSAMGQFVPDGFRKLVTDFVDVDSEKWREYSERKRWPMSWLYRREARLLAAYDTRLAKMSRYNCFVTRQEAVTFAELTGINEEKILTLHNGVDTDYFDPARDFPRVLSDDRFNLVFTGAMDYWPNVDAVQWFCQFVLPRISVSVPNVHFTIVGARPTVAVRRLHSDSVSVTGFVDDVRPYLAQCDAVVAPLRVARGIQNKVLEAMAMGKVVVATALAAEGIGGADGVHFVLADTDATFSEKVAAVYEGRAGGVGESARDLAARDFSWDARLEPLHKVIEELSWD